MEMYVRYELENLGPSSISRFLSIPLVGFSFTCDRSSNIIFRALSHLSCEQVTYSPSPGLEITMAPDQAPGACDFDVYSWATNTKSTFVDSSNLHKRRL